MSYKKSWPFVINGGTNKVQPLWAASAGEAIGKAAMLGDDAKDLHII